MNWINLKKHPTRFADAKNAPGIDYASKITQEYAKEVVAEATNGPTPSA
jgi:hypothetical protein